MLKALVISTPTIAKINFHPPSLYILIADYIIKLHYSEYQV